MGRVRVGTTVDGGLLADARRISGDRSDAVLIDEALRSFLLRHPDAELDAEYAAYEVHPLDEPDEWGDLATFRATARSSCCHVTRRFLGCAVRWWHRARRRFAA